MQGEQNQDGLMLTKNDFKHLFNFEENERDKK